jgi:hypothetical protein
MIKTTSMDVYEGYSNTIWLHVPMDQVKHKGSIYSSVKQYNSSCTNFLLILNNLKL